MLNRARVLIVEDEALIAIELAANVTDADGQVIGVCCDVCEALTLLDGVGVLPDAAILDINLPDGLVTPVALRLLDAGVAVVFHSASPVPVVVTSHTVRSECCPKVALAGQVMEKLSALLHEFGGPPPIA